MTAAAHPANVRPGDRRCFCNPPSPLLVTWAKVRLELPDGSFVETAVESFCTGCSAVIEPDHVDGRVVEADGVRLRAARLIGTLGNAAAFGLPAWDDLGVTVGSANVILPTTPMTRIDDWRRLDQHILEATIVKRIGVPKSHDPVVIPARGGCPPIIVHPGTARKFYLKYDDAHIRFSPMIPSVLREPVEVWRDVWQGAPVVRFLGKIRVGTIVTTLLVVAGSNDGILRTAYEIHPHQVPGCRSGLFVSAAWAAEN